jgi:hypothetical protein
MRPELMSLPPIRVFPIRVSMADFVIDAKKTTYLCR